MRGTIVFLFLLSTPTVYSQDNFKIPKKFPELPISYIEDLKIKDVNRQLSQIELDQLCRLIIKAHVLTFRSARQGFLLETNKPVYRLLKRNLPELAAYEGEGGHIIFYDSIVAYLKTVPSYKEVVKQAVREGPFAKENCREFFPDK
jgi:hypothetical protein